MEKGPHKNSISTKEALTKHKQIRERSFHQTDLNRYIARNYSSAIYCSTDQLFVHSSQPQIIHQQFKYEILQASSFQNQILDDLLLDNSEFNFVLHVNLISCSFVIFICFSYYSRFCKNILIKRNDAINSKFNVNISCLKVSFNK